MQFFGRYAAIFRTPHGNFFAATAQFFVTPIGDNGAARLAPN
jgi:hypothetical protein